MKVLIVGSGGREDALTWALSRSSRIRLLRCAPGNAGTARRAERVSISAEDVPALLEHIRAESYDLVVIGPEAPLVAGLADQLRRDGVAVFGPDAAAAQIEGSKIFAKELMQRHDVPTGGFRVFEDLGLATQYLRSTETTYPLVVKADGLAAGKGVILADDAEQAIGAVRAMLEEGQFGDAGKRVLVEEMLYGREASFFVLADGKNFVELATCQDYKRALDGDEGLNTGGMGTYSPSAYLDEATRRIIVDTVVRPTIDGLASEGSPFRGVLFVGLMLTESGPKVLEYNARFGDPETQVLLPRLDGDWLELLHACATGNLGSEPLRWKPEAAVCIVMAAGGYPGSYGKGFPIEGTDAAEALDGVELFHAGTTLDNDGRLVTSGGRVLGVTALGQDLDEARRRAYEAVGCIRWDKEHHRTDIAADAVRRMAEKVQG